MKYNKGDVVTHIKSDEFKYGSPDGRYVIKSTNGVYSAGSSYEYYEVGTLDGTENAYTENFVEANRFDEVTVIDRSYIREKVLEKLGI